MKKTLMTALSLSLLLGAGSRLAADLSPTVSTSTAVGLLDCFREAQARSESLASQQELIVQAEERYHQAWGSILPTINGYGQYTRQDISQLTAAQAASNPADQSTVRLSGDQPLFRGFREYAALDLAKASIVYQEDARRWAGLQLYQDVAHAFYATLALQKDLQTLHDEVDLYGQRITDLQQRASIGRSRQTEVLSVQSAQAILKAQAEQLHGQLDAAKDILSFLTGVDHGDLTETAQTPDGSDSLDSYLKDLEQRPDLQAAQKTVDIAKANVDIAKGGHWPNLDLLGNYYFKRPTGSSENIAWDASIVLNLPIFQGGVVASQGRVAESQVKQAELSLSLVQRSAQQDLRTAYHNLRSDQRQNVTLQDALDLSEKNYKAELRDYNLGLVTNLEVLQALSAYQDTQRALDKARFAAFSDLGALEAISARRLDLVGGK